MMSIHQKKLESARLEAEVKKWLKAEKQHIKELPQGFTKFPDGVIPTCSVRAQDSTEKRLEKERLIAEKNAAIRKQKEEAKAAKLAEKLKRQQERKEQREQERKRKAELKRIQQEEALKQLVQKHVPEQIEPVQKALKAPKKRERRKPLNPRIEFNRVARENAVNKGLKFFTGDCIKCSKTEYVLINPNTSHCLACRRERDRKRERGTKRNTDTAQRIERNKVKKMAAHALGLRHFEGECMKCGITTFEINIINGMVTCRCVPCRKKTNDRSRKKQGNYGDQT